MTGVEIVLRKVDEVTSDEIVKADGIVLGTPVEWGNLSAEAKRFLDRVGEVARKGRRDLRRGPDGGGILHRRRPFQRAGDGADGRDRRIPGDAFRDRRRRQ